ncbi:unconventional myosin 81F [Rhodnius prolixus]
MSYRVDGDGIGVPDMTMISDIDEVRINNNLRVRYTRDLIYTYAGTILVSVNPYKDLEIYGTEQVFEYHNRKMGALEPHVFALAEAAYKNLQTEDKNQSCVISGESGAGKTEATKFILQYLCLVTSNVSTWVEQQILEANTILEAFGNAKTVRNDNSSRFGKFMQVCFDNKWMIKGCIIQDYLLEQSRITFQSVGERNYHVFYQLVEGSKCNKDLAEQFMLNSADTFQYLNRSGCIKIEGVNDARKFDGLRLAFNVLRIPLNMCDGIFSVLSAILWLGNLSFEDIDGEKCQLTEDDKSILATVSKLLGLQVEDVIQVSLVRQINVRGNITEIPLKFQEAKENRHAMAKALYSRTFAWLVNHINTCTNPGLDSSRFLGVLDIFGFENFAVNSFEQLCINYTNEKLHKFFNHYVFALEQDIYHQEGIQFSHIEFTDNTCCLELIEKPPRCILKLLTEQCHMPKGSDGAYLVNLHAEFESHPQYVKGDDRRKWEKEFGIDHYAGTVTYSVEGFVDKNRDVQQDVFFDFMSRSTNVFVQELTIYQDLLGATSTRMGTAGMTLAARGTSKGKPTVSDTFRHQLQALVDVLQATNPWYVRCIKPNMKKCANEYDEKLVLDQLKYLGMLDIIRIRKEGYPIHMPIDQFWLRYKCLSKVKRASDLRIAISDLMKRYSINNKEWQLGKSKVFLRGCAHEPLEDMRNSVLQASALLIQKIWKGYYCYKEYVVTRNAVVKIQHAFRGWKLRLCFLKKRRAAIVIQSHLRGVFAREVALALREMRRVEEEMRKREKLEEEKRLREEQVAKEQWLERASTEENERSVTEADTVALSQMATHLNHRLVEPLSGGESVDLDNLFAFLSDVQTSNSPKNHIIDEIGHKMNELVSDLDVELETVIQQELAGLREDELLGGPRNTKVLKAPSLPEPTEPPPPPPAHNSPPLLAPSEQPAARGESDGQEPIYECVRPREDGGSPTPLPTPISPPPPVAAGVSPVLPPPNVANWRCNGTQDGAERGLRRKYRVEKKIQEMEQDNTLFSAPLNDTYHDIVEFAQTYFNSHERTPEGTIIATLTRKNKVTEMMPKYEMVTYYKGSTIPTSHIQMYDPDNVNMACSIFRDLCKYMKGEHKNEVQVIQSIIGAGLEREELRDEIFVQCMRQSTNNPSAEATERLWLLLCLTIVAFQPSKMLFKYFICFLRKNLQCEGKLRQYVQWCIDNCNNAKASCRQYPPSSVEIAAMRRLGTIVCRFFFLDGRTKAIDVHPTDTGGDATAKLADKLGLSKTDGWAVYQSRPDGEEHVRAHHFLYDVIAQWEIKQNYQGSSNSSFMIVNKRNNSTTLGCGENRFIFKKRLFRNTREISQDPVEVNMLYAQAVYSVVKSDDFPVSEKVAVQLAGLQAQVALGNPKEHGHLEYYTDVETYLPYRISRIRGDDVWVPILAQAHRQYGAGKTDMMAKVLYLSCVMQYPLYGTTMFTVTYRGYWSYGNSVILGVNCNGIMLIKTDDKFILFEFRFSEIESIFLDPSDSFITLTLMRHENHDHAQQHRCFVFETQQKTEVASLIVSYYPALSTWITVDEVPVKAITNEDRLRLYQNVLTCRRLLVDCEILRKPHDSGGGFIRNTLRRLSKHRLEKFRLDHNTASCDTGETYKGFSGTYWAFTRQPLVQSLTKLPEQDEHVAVQIFHIILNYAGLGQNGDTVCRAEDEHIHLLQTITERAMLKDSLLGELYLQLIKQTTDHPDPNSRVNLRHWALLSLACSVVLPPQRLIRKYLIAHLKKCSGDCISEEGKYARFAEKCLYKTQGTRRRQWPPSREEIMCTINRRPIYARFHFMDGQYHAVEFHPSATARDVVDIIKEKIGLRKSAMGYAIYEVLGSSERSLVADEKVADVMSKWERYRNSQAQSNAQANNQNPPKCTRKSHHLFLFKKHLFLDHFMDLDDSVEKELLYHQLLHSLRADRFPVTEKEAVMLTALQAQLELGDCGSFDVDYRTIASHCLPSRLVPNLPQEGIMLHYQSLRGMTSPEAKKAFLNLIRSWPFHRATIFDVMQSFTSNWPRVLWLAVDQVGLHLLEHRSRNALVTYEYDSILTYSPAVNCLMIITGSDKKQSKVILTTSQAFQVANLIKEYTEVLQSSNELRKYEINGKRRAGHLNRPISILHKPAPVIEPQPS